MTWISFAAAGLMALPGGGSAQEGWPGPAELSALLRQFDVPGMAMTVLEDCAPAGTVAEGAAILDPQAPVTPQTAFEAASLSKPVFAYLVMQLVDAGRIDLDRPIAETLPYPRITNVAAYGAITPRMVLTHRTGLPNWADEPGGPLAFETAPGTDYTYSGEGFELLRAQVESVTGLTLDALFKEKLGAVMPQSAFGPPLPAGATASRGYALARAEASGRPLGFRGGAAGGFVTTAPDYAAFLGLVCRGEGLSEAAMAAMLEPQSPAPQGDLPGPISWGLGWGIMALGPETVVLHGGDNGEYRSLAAFFPATGEGLAVLTNGANGGDLIAAMVSQLPGPPPPEGDGTDPVAAFGAFWDVFDAQYALFDVKHVDWDAVRAAYRPRVTAETTRDEVFAVFSEIVDLLNDVHVTVTDMQTDRTHRSGGRSIGTGPFEDGTFDLKVISERYLNGDLSGSAEELLHASTLNDGTGYVRIAAFRDPTRTVAAMDEAVAALSDAPAIIVDVRENGGGSDEVARRLASRFADEPRPFLTVAPRVAGTAPRAYGPVETRRLEPPDATLTDRPVIVLTNSRTISAAETFVIAMRTLPNTVVVGETTAGALADTFPATTAGDWRFTLPSNVLRDMDGLSWEGIGLPPDIYVANDPADLAMGRDQVLETAMDFAPHLGMSGMRQRIAP